MSNVLKDGQTLRTNSDGSRVVLDRNGKVVEVVEDGGRIRVPLYMMDGKSKAAAERKPTAFVDASAHRPHQVVATANATSPAMAMLTPEQQAQFDEAYAKRKKRLEKRYKHAVNGVVG
jgi:hypothetical protein